MKEKYYLSQSQQKDILKDFGTFPVSKIIANLFGSDFTLEQALSVCFFLEDNKCFQYIANMKFHNEILSFSSSVKDQEILQKIEKPQYTGIFQVRAVRIANDSKRRAGKWSESDDRLLCFLYKSYSKSLMIDVFYPRPLLSIQKRASMLDVTFSKTSVKRSSTKGIRIGDLKQFLEDYDDNEFLYIKKRGEIYSTPVLTLEKKAIPQITIL